ncbi:MAG: APC family permease [Candidatus Aenigmatarchaeota archaeon]
MQKKSEKTKIKKRLNFQDLLFMAIGSTIGAGVFVLLPIGINMAGFGIILSLVLAAVTTLIVAANYGELAASMPIEGGGYSWITRAFGKESSSFIVGWLIWLGNMGYAALSAIGFSIYAGPLFNMANPLPLALIAMGIFMMFNVVTMKSSINFEKFSTIALLFIFLVMWLFWGSDFNVANIQSSIAHTQFIPIFTSASLLYVLFVGFEAVSTMSGEAKRPSLLPKAFVYCVMIVTVVYILTSLAIMGFVPYSSIETEGAFLLNISGSMAPLVIFAAMLATLTSTNAGLIAASRNVYAISRDGMMPRMFRKISRQFNTPFVGVIASGLISGMFIMTNAVEYVASIADFGYLLCVSMVCSSVMFLRLSEPKLKRPYKVPFFPYSSLLGIVLPLLLIIFLEETAVNTGLIWIFVGFFVYNFYRLVKIETRLKRTKFYNTLRRFL